MRARPAAAALLVTAAGCGGAGGGSDAAPSAAVPTPAASSSSVSAPSCPPATAKPAPWPTGVPKDLPKPPASRILSDQRLPDGVRLVRFTTPTSLRTSVLFVIKQLPRAGFTLGRGDAEAREADAPFARYDVRGVLRLVGTSDCVTTWLLAFVPTGTAPAVPLLPSHSPSPSASLLPFG